MSEQVCPVCQGRGTVQPGFYLASPRQTIMLSSTKREDCQRCDGLGTITVGSSAPAVLEAHEP